MSGDVATFKRIRREFDETLPSLTAEFIRCMSWIWQRLPLYGFVRSHYDSAWNTTTPRTSSSKSAIGRYWASMICWLSWLFGWLSWISRWLSWMSGWVSWIVGTVTTGLLWMLTLFGVMWLLSELYCVFTPKVTSVRLTSFYMRNGWALPIHDENFWGPYDRSSFSPVGVSTGPASEPKKKDDNQELQGKESSARPQAALDPEYLLRCFENPEACEQDVINWEYLATRTSISLVQANPAIKATGDTLWRGWGLEIVSETDRVRIFYAFWMVALGLGTVLLATSTWKEKLENCFALSNLLLTLIVGGFQARSAHK